MAFASTLTERGVYCLANDHVFEWFEAFIRSFRKYNPTLPLTIIPFDERMSRIEALTEQYQFDIMDASDCSPYDAFSTKVRPHKKASGYYRKFACFTGKYRDFLFLDVDIVTLVSFDSLFRTFSESSSQFVYFDFSAEWCYSEKFTALMVAQYDSRVYNAGAFCSRQGLLSKAAIFATVEKAMVVRHEFAFGLADQPIFNYVTDISRLKYASLNELAPKFASSCWARQPFTYDWKTDTATDKDGKIIPFIHWAGCSYPSLVRPEIFLRYRTAGYSFTGNIGYRLKFHLLRCRASIRKFVKRWKPVIVKFFTNRNWRKYYLGKLMGRRANPPP